MSDTLEKHISISGIDQLKLFGLEDKNLRRLRDVFSVKVVARGQQLYLSGNKKNVELASRALEELITLASRKADMSDNDVDTILTFVDGNGKTHIADETDANEVILYKKEGFIKPKSPGQGAFCRSSAKNDIVFVIGPAGTGKTFLAVALAVAALRDKLVDRIMLTRPAVEAGERLGYLPGDFREKIDPYLTPLYDALRDMIPPDKLKRYLESGVIEIVPLAYMRGRTLNDAFVILDEAQNTTFNQMKMFLTRLGINAKSIITGDVTQIDLPDADSSGLVQVQSILPDIDGIDFVYMHEGDVVRHRLVREIIKAYDSFQGRNARQEGK